MDDMAVPVVRALRKLGSDLRDARRRRRIPAQVLAERASISRMTLYKIERGEGSVALGNYGSVIFALGLIERLAGLADAREDAVGRELDAENLPQRVRLRKSSKR